MSSIAMVQLPKCVMLVNWGAMSEHQMPGDQQSSLSSSKKGILKRSPRPSDATANLSPDLSAAESPAPHLKWDEANILWTETNRTATMKIDEPKTPFVRPEEIHELDMLEMRLEMDSAGGSRVSLNSAPSCSEFSDSAPSYRHNGEDDELDTEEARRKHEEFERRRQQHYEMKEALRRGRQLLESEHDYEDEGDKDHKGI